MSLDLWITICHTRENLAGIKVIYSLSGEKHKYAKISLNTTPQRRKTMSKMKTIYIDLVERYPLPLHNYLMGIPESLRDDAIELCSANTYTKKPKTSFVDIVINQLIKQNGLLGDKNIQSIKKQ